MATNGTGKGAKTFEDRQLAAEVRRKELEAIKLVLSDNPDDQEVVASWSDYKKRIVEKMSSSVLPRLNEVTGEDGSPITLHFDNAFAPQTEGDSPIEVSL